jgi:hypothetical protein
MHLVAMQDRVLLYSRTIHQKKGKPLVNPETGPPHGAELLGRLDQSDSSHICGYCDDSWTYGGRDLPRLCLHCKLEASSMAYVAVCQCS